MSLTSTPSQNARQELQHVKNHFIVISIHRKNKSKCIEVYDGSCTSEKFVNCNQIQGNVAGQNYN